MPSASNAQWNVEAGQQLTETELLADSGDHQIYTGSLPLWSSALGKSPVVLVNGVRNGFGVTAKPAVDNTVVIAAGQLNLNGVVTDIAGADLAGFVRPSGTAGADSIKHSVTVNAAGALAIAAGLEGTAYSTVRGAAGGPPFIPVGSVELAQVWLTDTAAAPIVAAEIFSVAGEHMERADTPINVVDAYAGQTRFIAALPLSHTGSLPKRTYAQFYTPIFLEIPNANNMQPPEISNTVNSTAVYKGAVGSKSSSLSQGSITVLVEDGIRDALIRAKDQGNLWHEFYPDANSSSKLIGQAYIGITRTYPADNNISVAVTLSAEKVWKEIV